MINIPAQEWLQVLLERHSPVIKDIGDQREPWKVIVCKCDTNVKPVVATATKYYQAHLANVLDEQYFKKLYVRDDYR